MFEQLVTSLEQAIDALVAIDRVVSENAAREPRLRERRSYAITPVGLIEAVRILSDGDVGAEPASRLLALFDEATRRFSAEHGLDVVCSPFFGADAARAFARNDARQLGVEQARLFSDLPRPELAPARPYSTGFAVPAGLDTTRAAEWCARVHAPLRCGALFATHAGERTNIAREHVLALAAARSERGAAPATTTSADSAPSSSLFTG